MYQPFKTWVEKSDYGTYIRSGAYIDVADEGDDLLFAATYDVYKSDNLFFNEKTKRMEPILFALITGFGLESSGGLLLISSKKETGLMLNVFVIVVIQ